MELLRIERNWAAILAMVVTGVAAPAAAAVASLYPCGVDALSLYARQTGEPCATRHVAFPELTPTGRRFKLNGYTLGGGASTPLPFADVLQPAYTHRSRGSPWAAGLKS